MSDTRPRDDTRPDDTHSDGARQDHSWQDALATGRADRALQHYLAVGAPNLDVQDTLDGLAAVQRHLRAKRYRKAEQTLELLDVPPEPVSAVLPWGALPELLETLRESNERLEHRDSGTALELLQDLDHPLVRAEADTQRGTAYIFQNDTSAAGECFDRALEHDPNHYRALTNQGNLALEAGDTDTAISRYETALRLNEDFGNAHHNLAVAYRRKGQIGKSVSAMRKAQRATQQHTTQEARATLSQAGQRFGGKAFKWLLYGVGAAVLFYILQSRGIL
ncbi:MAG: tetratricopeptide repeat protein [Trueperaceae bacterium]|nr:tetratricopeptide repeat protein [Trueperaceae bacterium]